VGSATTLGFAFSGEGRDRIAASSGGEGVAEVGVERAALEAASILTPLISRGLSLVEASRVCGKPTSWASSQLSVLRDEIEAQLESSPDG
jgi:hypothetical protein